MTADLDAVYEFAKKMPAGNKVVAVGGFCWGGGQTFNYAAHNPKIAAAFVFYGSAPKMKPATRKSPPRSTASTAATISASPAKCPTSKSG